MNCEQIELWISADQDGELDARRRRLLREHLACCPECRAVEADWEELARELRSQLSRTDAPATLLGRVMRQLPAQAPAPTRAGRAGFWRPQASLSLAVVPLVAAVAWLLLAPRLPRPVIRPAERVGTKLAAAAVLPSLPPPGRAVPVRTRPPVDRAATEHKQRSEEKAKATGGSRIMLAPAAHSKRRPERMHPLTEWQRQLRELRRARRRYPIATLPRREHRSGRRRAPERLARRFEPVAPGPEAPAGAPAPRIAIVDYVLPQLLPQVPAAEAGADWVLPPAEPAPAADAGVAL